MQKIIIEQFAGFISKIQISHSIYLIHSYFYLRALVAEAKEISHFVAKLNEDNKNSVNEDDIIDTKEWTR